MDWEAREGAKDEVTFEQRLKVVREQEGIGLAEEHLRKCKVQRRQQQVWLVKGTRTQEGVVD